MARPQRSKYRRERDDVDPEDERRSRRPARTPAFSAGPVVGFVVLLGAAIGIAGWANKAKTEAAQPETPAESRKAYVPFADVPSEAPPQGSSGGAARPARGLFEDLAGDDELAGEQAWREAQLVAEEATELLRAASRAKEEGDFGTYQDKAKAARDKYSEALEDTSEWYEALVARLGESSGIVSRVRRERSDWTKTLVALHKMTGR